MTSILKKSFLMALACVCIGTYGVVKAQDAMDAQTKVSGPLEMSVEAAVPGVVMPSPVHVFTTVEAASEYIGFRPQMPKLLPVGFNIQSVITIEKDILQVVYVYEPGTKVTFKGSDKMVYLASWMKDGQNHSLEFQGPVTRDMAKAIIRNIVEEKSHTK